MPDLDVAARAASLATALRLIRDDGAALATRRPLTRPSVTVHPFGVQPG